jgi:proteasome lid subunit RPN8/RPN11
MTLQIDAHTLAELHAHLEAAYPEEGAGFLLGDANLEPRAVTGILKVDNAREQSARRNRFLITPHDMLRAEDEAERRGLDILGVFHSHPDCPNIPSEFDREWALPWYSYTISRVDAGKAVSLRAWRLAEDRRAFDEEAVVMGNE